MNRRLWRICRISCRSVSFVCIVGSRELCARDRVAEVKAVDRKPAKHYILLVRAVHLNCHLAVE